MLFLICHSPCGSVDWNHHPSLLPSEAVVTPLAGVWIEIALCEKYGVRENVTPLAGVWIEISYNLDIASLRFCHSPCGSVDWNILQKDRSQPAPRHSPCGSVDWNHNLVLILQGFHRHSPCGSVDWNLFQWIWDGVSSRHSPCGSVDWNNMVAQTLKDNEVTPLAGVWIEIAITTFIKGVFASLPLRECGLKYNRAGRRWLKVGHSPCGSVDWNCIRIKFSVTCPVTPLAGVWIEMLFFWIWYNAYLCHSPCGSVDWNYSICK